jgi:hypothetical protein
LAGGPDLVRLGEKHFPGGNFTRKKRNAKIIKDCYGLKAAQTVCYAYATDAQERLLA